MFNTSENRIIIAVKLNHMANHLSRDILLQEHVFHRFEKLIELLTD